MASICVYCGSSPGVDSVYFDAAVAMGECLADAGHTLIYGGGNAGLMGAVADAALARGGEVIGVIPQDLFDREVAHTGLTALHEVSTMHERKFKMALLADAFIALPGGIGTLEEIVEVFVWTQLKIHAKPCGLLNVQGYYDALLTFLHRMTDQHFLHPAHLEQLVVDESPSALLESLLA